jgi:hypothetical protein
VEVVVAQESERGDHVRHPRRPRRRRRLARQARPHHRALAPVTAPSRRPIPYLCFLPASVRVRSGSRSQFARREGGGNSAVGSGGSGVVTSVKWTLRFV